MTALFARKRLPAALVEVQRNFERALAYVERAKEELTSAVPVARVAPRSLAEALFGFDTELLHAQGEMPSWFDPAVEREWSACSEGLAQALDGSQRLRVETGDLGFESLVGAIGDLIAPLDPFERAAERFEELKV